MRRCSQARRREPAGGIETASLMCSSTPGAREKRCQRLAASRLPLEREGEREGERDGEAERFERRGEPSSGSRELDRSAGSSLLENSAGELAGGGEEIREDLRSRR